MELVKQKLCVIKYLVPEEGCNLYKCSLGEVLLGGCTTFPLRTEQLAKLREQRTPPPSPEALVRKSPCLYTQVVPTL